MLFGKFKLRTFTWSQESYFYPIFFWFYSSKYMKIKFLDTKPETSVLLYWPFLVGQVITYLTVYNMNLRTIQFYKRHLIWRYSIHPISSAFIFLRQTLNAISVKYVEKTALETKWEQTFRVFKMALLDKFNAAVKVVQSLPKEGRLSDIIVSSINFCYQFSVPLKLSQ